MRARLALVVLVVLEAAAVWAVATGVPAPQVDWARLGPWLQATSPEDVTLAGGRLLLGALAGWLLLTTLLAVGATLLGRRTEGSGRRRGTPGRAARLAPAAVRHLVEVALAAGALTAGGVPAAAAPPPAPARAVPAAAARPLVAPLAPLRDGRASLDPPVAVAAPDPAPASTPVPAPPPAPTAGIRHRVAAGEHLWGIAEAVVAARGASDDPAAVERYWRALCDANRAHLASGDPDVLAPGEELDLPPVA